MKVFYSLLKALSIFILFLLPDILMAQDNDPELKYRRWRITLFPPLSTNGVEAPNYTAKYSINILGGYHGALDGIEVGGLFNYNKYYAHGFQLVGGANITGGDMAGFNIAGLANISADDMSGIQFSGISNVSGDDLQGVQASGLLNVANGYSSGLQFSGIGNIAKEDLEGLQGSGVFNASLGNISGLQFAGLGNVALKDVEGLQLAGTFNIAGENISGLQISSATNIAIENLEGLMVTGGVNFARKDASGLLIAGGLNYAHELDGLAISGGANIAKELDGLQIAGFLNASKEATGMQIGVINLAKEFYGMPVGLISLYGNGRKNIDIRFADGGFTDVGLNLGTYRVYNMIYFGFNSLLERNVYRLGWSIGLEKKIQDVFPNAKDSSMYVNQEFSVAHHFEEEWDRTTNLIYSYKYLFGKKFGSGFSLYAGPSINMQVTRVDGADDYTWYSLWSPTAKGRQYRFWIGFNIGVRLFKQKELPLFNTNHDEYENWKLDW